MEKITRQEAIEKIKEWSLFLESTDPEAEGLTDAIEPLILPIVNGRLDFDEETGTFNLKLKTPIQGEKETKELVTIHELTIAEKKVVQRFKDAEKIDQSEALLAKAIDIPLGWASRIGSRDQTVISAVLTVFSRKPGNAPVRLSVFIRACRCLGGLLPGRVTLARDRGHEQPRPHVLLPHNGAPTGRRGSTKRVLVSKGWREAARLAESAQDAGIGRKKARRLEKVTKGVPNGALFLLQNE